MINVWYARIPPIRSKSDHASSCRAMSRDEEKFPNAHEFRPERHFTPDGSLRSDTILNDPLFGFGRRICEAHLPTKDKE